MPQFHDADGQSWRLELNVDAVKRVRSDAEFDLLAIGDPQQLGRLIDCPVTLVEVVWSLVQGQARERGVSPEDFGRGMRGAALEAAADCLLESLTDFFPPRRGRLLAAALDKLRKVQALQETVAQAELDAMTDDAILEKLTEMRQTPGS